MLVASMLMQVTFFIVVSSSSEYAKHLGGTSTFSGLTIGIPVVFAGLALVPMMKYDGGGYKLPLHFACACAIIGNILYSLAYAANWLYLILVGRMVSGLAMTFFLYSKRYCSDPRIVGIRRRTTLAGWLVLGQSFGFSIGPFLGGLLYKIGFSNSVFNGYTSPTWVLAGIWAVFWAIASVSYEDVSPTRPVTSEIQLHALPSSPEAPHRSQDDSAQAVQGSPSLTDQATSAYQSHPEGMHGKAKNVSAVQEVATQGPEVEVATVPASRPSRFRMTGPQIGVTVTMCWFAMTCFFILGAWEANIPVFTASDSPLNPFHFSPFAAGNIIALGGVSTFPLLFANLFIARRVQDRHTLAVGTTLGLAGLLTAVGILATRTVTYGSFFACWFLIALGFNIISTIVLSLLSKQLPGEWNGSISLAIQYSMFSGRVSGAVWGGAGVQVGMLSFVGLQIGLVCVGAVLFSTLWRQLKAKTG